VPFSKYILYLLFFTLNILLFNASGQSAENKISVNTKVPFDTNGYLIPKESTLILNFELENKFAYDTSFVIKIGREQLAQLFENKVNRQILLAETGAQIPIPNRSIKADGKVILFEMKAFEKKSLRLAVCNFLKVEHRIKPLLLSKVSYQLENAKLGETFYHKYWNTSYFVLLILVLLFTIIQYNIIPEKYFKYYFLYLFFTLIRSASFVEALVIENWLPFLVKIGYSSANSQVFTYLSLIFYVLFLREFTNFKVKKPHLDYFFKIQIGFLLFFIVFDLIYPSEKYNNNQINFIFRSLETFGLVLGVINLILLFRVYDIFNKYVLIGAVSLFLIAMVGQEIVKRGFDGNADPESYNYMLIMVWTVAYLVEISFFTLALVSRQIILVKTMAVEKKQNIEMKALLEQKNTISEPVENIDYEQFALATNKGVLVFQQEDIVRLEASGNYTIFTIKNNKQTLASYTLSDFEPKLNPTKFLRVHKSHFVNLNYIVKYTKGDGGTITMEDGTEIPVSRSRKDELLKRLHTS
jgi:LytTr DNA-binding domain